MQGTRHFCTKPSEGGTQARAGWSVPDSLGKGRMKKPASTEPAGCEIDGAQDPKKEILVKMLLVIRGNEEYLIPEASVSAVLVSLVLSRVILMVAPGTGAPLACTPLPTSNPKSTWLLAN